MPDAFSGAVVAVAAIIVLSALGFAFWKMIAGYRERTGVLSQLAKRMEEASEVSKESAAKLAEAGAAVRAAADMHGKAVALLQRSLFGNDNRGFIGFDEDAANRQYEIQTLIEQGIPAEEAIARVNERRVHESRAKGDVISRMRLEG